jgi:hypothetical protein
MSNMWRFEFDHSRMLATFDNEIFDLNLTKVPPSPRRFGQEPTTNNSTGDTA